MTRAIAILLVAALLFPVPLLARDARESRTLQDAAQTSPIDVSNVTNEGNQSSNSTLVTTTVGNDLLLSLPKWETATWSSYGAGETEDMAPTSSDMGWTAGSYKNAASTAGTETMTITISPARDVDEPVVAVKSAGSSASSVTVTDTYTYAGTNYANPHAVTQIANGVSTTTFAYDNNGNLIQKINTQGSSATTTLLTWDYANRLTQTAIGTSQSTTTSTYGYDWQGSRVFQTTGATTTHYVGKYFSRVFATNGATTTATTTSYIYAGDTLLATFDGSRNGTTTSYLHPDHLGSTALVTSSTGSSTLQTLDYMPYGSIRTNSNTGADTGRKYIGLFEDAQTDLVYANARYLEPSRGQFTSQDPMFNEDPRRQTLTNPQSLNSYAYANGNPISNKDPLGLRAFSYNFLSGSAEGGFRFGAAGSFNVGLTFVTGYDGGLAITTSYGAAGTTGQQSVSYPSANSISGIPNNGPFVLGTSASAGCGIPQCSRAFQLSGSYSPTVDSLSDLEGPANSINVAVPFASFSQQTDAEGNNTYTFGVKGLSRGASVSTYPVQNSSYTLVNTRSVINTATNAYNYAQSSFQTAVSSIQAQINSLKAQVAKLMQASQNKPKTQ